MNILQRIFTNYYEEIKYTLHPRVSEIENIEKMINCGDPYFGGAKGKLLNSVGSGDSMVAGFIAGYLKEKKYDEALKLGSACGGATAFSEDLAEASMIQEVYKQLKVEEL